MNKSGTIHSSVSDPSSKRSLGPTSFYPLTFCFHIIGYVLVWIATFTPNWASITEFDGVQDLHYEKGIFISCNVPGGLEQCGFNEESTSQSHEFVACFLLTIASLVLGFLVFQVLVLGACVRSLKERNLGLLLTFMFILMAGILSACILLFKVSIPKDVTPGNDYRNHTFGVSRYMLTASVALYFLSAFFASGEYFKRKERRPDTPPSTFNGYAVNSDGRSPSAMTDEIKNIINNNINNNNNNNNNKMNKFSSNTSRTSNSLRQYGSLPPPYPFQDYSKYNKRTSSSVVVALENLSYF